MLKEKILRLSPAFALAFVVAASGVSSQALAMEKAGHVFTHVGWIKDKVDNDGIGDTEVKEDEDGDLYFTFYDENGKMQYTKKLDSSNPKPDGGSTGLVDPKGAIEEFMKNGGAEIEKTNNFLETTLGQTLIKDSKTGSIVPVHNPDPLANGLVRDPLGDNRFEQDKNQGSTGGGWYDPMGGSMVEQMIKAGKKNKGKDNKGSGDAASDARNPGYEFSADPALVNPVPELLSAAKLGKKKVRYAPAPALIKKGKKRLRNTAKFYPTIPNRPSPTMTNNSPSRRNGVLRKRRRAASGNFRTMLGQGSTRWKARKHNFGFQHSNRIKMPTSRNRLR
jgi:hypothetical protein